jgi:hypothetical protein
MMAELSRRRLFPQVPILILPREGRWKLAQVAAEDPTWKSALKPDGKILSGRLDPAARENLELWMRNAGLPVDE